jgi:hypothetical protein
VGSGFVVAVGLVVGADVWLSATETVLLAIAQVARRIRSDRAQVKDIEPKEIGVEDLLFLPITAFLFYFSEKSRNFVTTQPALTLFLNAAGAKPSPNYSPSGIQERERDFNPVQFPFSQFGRRG